MSYILFFITYTITLISLLTAILKDMGEEVLVVRDLIMRDGPPAVAIFGIVLIFIMVFVFVQILFTARILFLIIKYIFKISLPFRAFYRVVLISNLFFSLGNIFSILFLSTIENVLLSIINPFYILGIVCFYYLMCFILRTNRVKTLIFSSFIYIIGIISMMFIS